ncbi:uncharacterized protein LOC136082549 [Hydra vulgaris]|uniref:Uncharacterized protein LOC136082549 n=1 Tax=Hydra vulgaris TaxID=6087 RepID=A0ABM4C8T0_HYDVU
MNAQLKHEIKLKRNLWYCYKISDFKNKELNQKYKEKNERVKNLVKSSIIAYEKKIVVESKQNPKKIYAYINSKLTVKDHIRSLITDKNELSNDVQFIANYLNRFFCSVFTDENLKIISLFESVTNLICPIPLFNKTDIANRLSKLNANKSPGSGKVHPLVLNSCAESLSKPLCIIFNRSLELGTLPELWLEANITPLFKKGERLKTNNYRPISLTSIVCKLMESFVRDTIMKHFIDNNLITKDQHGFIKTKSCITNLLETLDVYLKLLILKKSKKAISVLILSF